jgi:hypothetical protein
MRDKIVLKSPEKFTSIRDTLNQALAKIRNELINPFEALLSKINLAQHSAELKKMYSEVNFLYRSFKFAMDRVDGQVNSYNKLLEMRLLVQNDVFNESGNNPFVSLLEEARDALNELEALKPRALQLIEETELELNEVATFRSEASAMGFFNQHPNRGDNAPNNSRSDAPVSTEESDYIVPNNSRSTTPAPQA